MKTLNISELFLVAGGNDEVVEVLHTAEEDVATDVADASSDISKEITKLEAIHLPTLAFGCCS